MKLTPAKLTVLNEIATAGFVRGKTAQLRDLIKAGLIDCPSYVVAKDNYATLTDAGRELVAEERWNQTKRALKATAKKHRETMRALDEAIAKNNAMLGYLDEMARSFSCDICGLVGVADCCVFGEA